MRIAVIGAGAGGLVAIKYCIQEGYECEAFEQTDLIGGTWNYTDEVGLDKNGLPVHTSMYENLRTNLPKEVMMFEDFPWKEDLKESYISQKDVLEYLNDYAEKKDLRKYIKFLTQVTLVEPLEGNKWRIEIKDVLTKEMKEKIFDAVIVCNGKYEVPYLPQINGLESFTGNCIHSHNYRSVEPYKDKVVLVIGGGPSGIDISSHIHRVAKKVIISFRTAPAVFHFPPEISKKPPVVQIENSNITFDDDSREAVDEIVLCTGYKYDFPFLSEKCGVVVDDNYIKGLYKECLCIEQPTMVILGLPQSVCPIPTFELQVRFLFSILTSHYCPPTKEMMIKENENARNAKKCSNRQFHKKGVDAERIYWDDLAKTASVRAVPGVVTKLHEYVFSQRRDPTQSFRIINDEEFKRIA